VSCDTRVQLSHGLRSIVTRWCSTLGRPLDDGKLMIWSRSNRLIRFQDNPVSLRRRSTVASLQDFWGLSPLYMLLSLEVVRSNHLWGLFRYLFDDFFLFKHLIQSHRLFSINHHTKKLYIYFSIPVIYFHLKNLFSFPDPIQKYAFRRPHVQGAKRCYNCCPICLQNQGLINDIALHPPTSTQSKSTTNSKSPANGYTYVFIQYTTCYSTIVGNQESFLSKLQHNVS